MRLTTKRCAFAAGAVSLFIGGQAIAAFSPGDVIVKSDGNSVVENDAAVDSKSLPQLHDEASSSAIFTSDRLELQDPWSNPTPLPAGATTDPTGSNQYDWGTVEWGAVYDSSGKRIGDYEKRGDQIHFTPSVPFYENIPVEVIGVSAAVVVAVVAVTGDDSPTSP